MLDFKWFFSFRQNQSVSMDFLIVALTVRLAGTVFLASLLGAGLWLLGVMLLASSSSASGAVVQLSTILGFGVGAGIVAWIIDVRMEEVEGGSGWVRLAAFVALAVGMTAAGLFLIGGILLDDGEAFNPAGAHGTPEVVGAWLGSALGATLVPGVRGTWRVAHRREP